MYNVVYKTCTMCYIRRVQCGIKDVYNVLYKTCTMWCIRCGKRGIFTGFPSDVDENTNIVNIKKEMDKKSDVVHDIKTIG